MPMNSGAIYKVNVGDNIPRGGVCEAVRGSGEPEGSLQAVQVCNQVIELDPGETVRISVLVFRIVL